MKTEKYNISGMSCAACSSAVERVVSRLEGVKTCEVNLMTNSMTVSYNEKTVDFNDFKRVVEKAGFGITSIIEKKEKIKKENTDNFSLIFISLISSAVLLLISMGPMLISDFWLPEFLNPKTNPYNYAITQLLLTIPALIVGKKFFLKGIPLLFKGHPNMDSLVAIGASASFIFSLVMTYTINNNPHAIHNLYFESVAVVITLVMLGKYFESKSKKKTADAINKLMELSPDTAVLFKDGKEIALPLEEIKKGDILIVKSGEKIPIDAKIIEGISSVDESMLTGESMPVTKTKGDNVTGGSINLDGRLIIEVIRTGEDTTLSKIIRFVEEASSKKAPISKTADKVAGIFVPFVILVAVISAIIWFIISKDFAFCLKIFMGVLVVACPCALGLATPTAIMVGTGLGANNGILIKNGEVLEISHKIKAVVFDKTGTVTIGKPEVCDIISEQKEELIKLALLAESGSLHPLASAIRECAEKSEIITHSKIDNLINIAGKGVIAETEGKKIILGNKSLLEENGVSCDKYLESANELSSQGKSIIYLALNGILLGLIAVSDSLKKESAETFKELKNMGIKTILLSGDNKLSAEYVGKILLADEIFSEVLPQDKGKIIKEIRKKYGSVMMIGDGINDAIALSEADVGCAIGNGSDIAIESSDIVLMKNNPFDAVKAIKLSKLTIRNIKQNLFWAFCYNTVLIPIAAGVCYPLLLNPMLAGLAMSLSSVFVVGNALRLRGKKL